MELFIHITFVPYYFNLPLSVSPADMASIETGVPSHATTETPVTWSSKLTRFVSDTGKVAVNNHGKLDVALRGFMLLTTLTAVIVMATSKQTEMIRVAPTMTISANAKLTHSGSFTYFVAAASVTFLYSIYTGYSSYSSLKNQQGSSTDQMLKFVITDSLMLGILGSATGATFGVAYEALKGNHHIHWMKICNVFDSFCDHIVAAGGLSIGTSVTLLLLIWLSVHKTAKKR